MARRSRANAFWNPFQLQRIMKAHRLHDHGDFMVAIGALAQDVKRQVDFRLTIYRNQYPLPSSIPK